jgi:predicted acyl esterase
LLHLRLDVPDTDLMYLLQALLPDGRALLLSADMLRLRYRGWDGSERLMTPGESELLRFEGARFVARRLPAGTALRLTIRAPASIYLERHGNRGSPVCEPGA